MNPVRNISTAPLEHPAMDYAFLRQAGISHLERMAGQLWTDFNAHDPGITILEQLCYAITDLGYRIDYDLKDLLAGGAAAPYRALYSPAEILTTNPVTLADLRKVAIDVDGVKNAWVEPVEDGGPALFFDASDRSLYLEAAPHRAPVSLRGLYRVLIEADGTRADLDLVRAVRQRLQSCRNLGEVFEPPTILSRQPITVTARVEVGAIDDPDRLLAQIYHALARFISPTIRFYTLSEILARGKRIDEIMDGPPLSRGFIDSDELERFERKRGLRASDLIQEIMNVAGVSAVDDISLSDGRTTDHWYLNLSQASNQNSTPVLDIETPLFSMPSIQLARDGIPLRSTTGQVKAIFDSLRQADQYPPLPEALRDVRLPPGRDRDVGRYYSIQHQFPAAYGIGELGLPASAPAQRQAQARQLKAYLLFFDQLLANYFAQLANVKELFAFDSPWPRTYFAQLIDDARLGLDDIWLHDRETRAARLQSLADEGGVGRKSHFLDHLLARFAEQFTDYSLHAFAEAAPEDLIEAKSAFLRDYRELGAARSRAFDDTLPAWGTENVSGLEKRISRKLGLASYRRRDLADLDAGDPGGFHMLEPILLRPQRPDLDQWTQTSDSVGWQAPALLALPQAGSQPRRADPFSMRLCFVFPDWISRFDGDFAGFVLRMLREETPAHLDVQVQWLSREEMRAFESAYKDWLASLPAGADAPPPQAAPAEPAPRQSDSIKPRAARDRLIDLLRIGDPYPLRDLELSYPQIVALDQSADIQILGAQLGVCYQLCDQDGNPIVDDGKPIEAMRAADQTDDQVILKTPGIVKDITFTILAARPADAYGTQLDAPLETYLRTSVAIKAGINTGLPVAPEMAAGQTRDGARITISYGDTLKVAISASQQGVSYVLIEDGKDGPLSAPVEGNKDTIVLTIDSLREDIDLQVKAYRTQEPGTAARLATTLSVHVRPNPRVAVSLDPSAPPIVDYAASATLVLDGAQGSAGYQLYRHDLVPADYVAQDTPGRLEIKTNDRSVFVRAPEQIASWDKPAGFVLAGSFQKQGEKLSITIGGLTADTLCVVLATKTANQERVQLDQAPVVLVRPDPRPRVGAVQPAIPANAEGLVTVSGTQQGVMYQLRQDSDSSPINAPGYDYRDRGLETTRIEVDFVVETPDDPSAYQTLLLPTGKVTARTTYHVLATKILTGVSAQLNDKAMIDTTPAPRNDTGGSANAST